MQTFDEPTTRSQNEIRIVSTWLKMNGYNHVQNVVHKSGVEIIADSNIRHICVHVKIEQNVGCDFITKRQIPLSERKKLREYGDNNHREPWLAVLCQKPSGEIEQDVFWIDLSK